MVLEATLRCPNDSGGLLVGHGLELVTLLWRSMLQGRGVLLVLVLPTRAAVSILVG